MTHTHTLYICVFVLDRLELVTYKKKLYLRDERRKN